MSTRTWLESAQEKYRGDAVYQTEALALSVGSEIRRIMKQRGLTGLELAKRLGVSSAYVSRLLNDNPNLTLKSLAKISVALEAQWEMPRLASCELPRGQELQRGRPQNRVQQSGDDRRHRVAGAPPPISAR